MKAQVGLLTPLNLTQVLFQFVVGCGVIDNQFLQGQAQKVSHDLNDRVCLPVEEGGVLAAFRLPLDRFPGAK